jgi:diguanylate cyclase (GGDEF)-like protein
MVLDLARFRQINETLGRHAGDFFLKRLALRLKSSHTGRADIARLVGDSFALVLPGIRGEADAARIFENEIVPAIDSPIEFEGLEYRLSARAGIALGPAEHGDAEALLQNAEAALARAKRSGERRLFYEPEMNARVGERLHMENKLRTALEKNQFVLHYQPKFDTSTRTITGLEALLRWADPEDGLVAPAKFIPLLEETGMILEVGRWAMGQALSDRSKWQRDGLAVPRVAVNISAIQLQQQDFAGTVREIIAHHPYICEQQACGLDLEITESLVMTDIESTIEKLKVIRDLGIGIHIDDFGTGYSSLSYISRLPIHAIKIDRAFVNGMTTHANDRHIVSIIISLAHSLNISVVAEGVETEEQLGMLGILECDEVQGYLLGRPMPAEGVAVLLSS